MKFIRFCIVVFIFLVPTLTFSQKKDRFTISGIIKDQNSGETLTGATVGIVQLPGIGVITNSYGFYSITLKEGHYTLVSSFAGYNLDTTQIELSKNVTRNINLQTTQTTLQEVRVSVVRKDNNITKTLAGVQRLSTEDIKDVPVIFGEKDILKTIQLLPGIKSAGDGRSGFYVRGGAADQNLILLDEATVYNASHLLGFFSVFNSDAIKDITVYKGGMPSNYGGRLSSIENIIMKDGNNQRTEVSGGIGVISSRLNVEGPIVKNKGSFLISARRTYADVFLGLSKDTTINKNVLYFYDLNLKANYIFNKNNRVYLSGYFGKDVLAQNKKFQTNWGNSTGTLRWNHIFNDKLFSNTSLIYSDFNYNISITNSNNSVAIRSLISDLHFKEDLNYFLSTKSKIDVGLDAIYHVISPGEAITSNTSSYNPLTLQKKYSLENAFYVSHELSISPKLKLIYGMRLSAFSILGPGNFYGYDKAGNINSIETFGKGNIVKTYFNPEPRIDVGYQLDDNSSVKLSYTRNIQNIHLLNNSTAGAPTSLYIPSSKNILPEIADQVSTGYYKNINNNQFEFSSEVYYKDMKNQIDYKDDAKLLGNEYVESQLLSGTGRAYGWETFFKKKYGTLTGWISYTLSRTEKKIPGINKGNYYPAAQDQTHNVSVVGMYKAGKRWTLSATWVYNTGNAITWPSGKFPVDGIPVFLYQSRNAYRMPAYHRLDLGATLEGRKKAKYESSWSFSIYNAYARSNPFIIEFQKDPNNPDKTQALQTTLFKLVPSVTYNFKIK